MIAKSKHLVVLFIMAAAMMGCDPDVLVTHSPAVAKSSETVTYTAELKASGGASPSTVEIMVNGAVVQTCEGMNVGDECTYTGGPYPDYENWVVTYGATATNADGASQRRYGYQFGITDDDYNFRPMGFDFTWIPARNIGPTRDKEDLVFHMAPDYVAFEDFVSDVTAKIQDVYAKQDIIDWPERFDTFNFYVYTKTARDAEDCGIVHADAETDLYFRDDDVVLHMANLTDCTRGDHFSAEGSDTKAFLHESGHAVFDLADEYDDSRCWTHYYQPADEPNIFSSEAACRAEQTDKGRDPDACWEYTSCSGGWWGIHQLADNTVMIRGRVGDPWGVEATEHMYWYFSEF